MLHDILLLLLVDFWTIGDRIDASCLLYTVQSARNYTFIVCIYVGLELSLRLWKFQGIRIAIKIVPDDGNVLFELVRIAIFVYNIDDTFDHLLLRDLASNTRTVWQIFAKPNFDYPPLIDADIGLLDFKIVSKFLSQQLEPI